MQLDDQRLLLRRKAMDWQAIAIHHEDLASLQDEPVPGYHVSRASIARAMEAKFESERLRLEAETDAEEWPLLR